MLQSPFSGVFSLEGCVELQHASKDQFLFVWMAALGRILTNDSLRKRWLVIIDWCCGCKRAGESTNHLLLHCPIDSKMWSMVFTLFGLSWVMPKDVLELLASWPGKFRKHRNGEIWNMVPHCMIWGIWRERNV